MVSWKVQKRIYITDSFIHILYYRCISVEEYEVSLIDQYYCSECYVPDGAVTSNNKKTRCIILKDSSLGYPLRNRHRYESHLITDNLRKEVQIGTRKFIDDFLQKRFIRYTNNHMIFVVVVLL